MTCASAAPMTCTCQATTRVYLEVGGDEEGVGVKGVSGAVRVGEESPVGPHGRPVLVHGLGLPVHREQVQAQGVEGPALVDEELVGPQGLGDLLLPRDDLGHDVGDGVPGHRRERGNTGEGEVKEEGRPRGAWGRPRSDHVS
jgi:hypothetical protein